MKSDSLYHVAIIDPWIHWVKYYAPNNGSVFMKRKKVNEIKDRVYDQEVKTRAKIS